MPRISLRTILIALTVFCLLLGWWAQRSEFQKHAVKTLRERGVQLEYLNEFYAETQADWLAPIFGIDYVDRIAVVRIKDVELPDSRPLRHLPGVVELHLESRELPSFDSFTFQFFQF